MSDDKKTHEESKRDDHKLKIFIGGISFKSTKESLEKAFSGCGKVADVFIPKFRDSDKIKGIAFITFETEEAVEKALKLDDTEVDGRKVRIERSSNQEKKKKEDSFNKNSIMIKNLNESTDEDGLKKHFKDFGTITRCFIPTDRDSNKSKGFAFIDYEKEEEAEKALKFNKDIDGNKVEITFAKPKKERYENRFYKRGGDRGGFRNNRGRDDRKKY